MRIELAVPVNWRPARAPNTYEVGIAIVRVGALVPVHDHASWLDAAIASVRTPLTLVEQAAAETESGWPVTYFVADAPDGSRHGAFLQFLQYGGAIVATADIGLRKVCATAEPDWTGTPRAIAELLADF
jgi:hypothetical protein